VNAYIIPNDRAIASLRDSKNRGVKTKFLTNSLASHDVPAVNSHHKQWRTKILETGADLHEIRHDAAIQPLVADTPPTRAKFMGLHSKAMVVDRQRVYIGSMNFDPRSANISTEWGSSSRVQALPRRSPSSSSATSKRDLRAAVFTVDYFQVPGRGTAAQNAPSRGTLL
jgi:hypothetical protein